MMSTQEEFEPLTLVFLVGGQAVLEEGEGDEAEIVWASDADEDFADVIDHEFLTENDSAAIFTYLVEEGYLDEADVPDIPVEIESYQPEDVAQLFKPN